MTLIEQLSGKLGEINNMSFAEIFDVVKYYFVVKYQFDVVKYSLPSLSFCQISWFNNDRSKLHFLPKNTPKSALPFPCDRCGDVLY